MQHNLPELLLINVQMLYLRYWFQCKTQFQQSSQGIKDIVSIWQEMKLKLHFHEHCCTNIIIFLSRKSRTWPIVDAGLTDCSLPVLSKFCDR